jgi:DNA-binding winged helix-turn-helix (wHTH) protein/Tol biopolymer transport system component
MSLQAKIFRFANFTLDTDERVLLEDGSPVPITPKALQLLSVLVECHGHIVEKEMLMAAVWPDSFVEDSNLTFNIRQIRKTLGDRKDNSIFIETVPRRGYRFVAPVEELEGSPIEIGTNPINGFGNDSENGNSAFPLGEVEQMNGSAAATLSTLSTSLAQRPFSYRWLTAVLVVCMIALAAFGYVLYRFEISESPRSAPDSIIVNGRITNAVITPDGKKIVFAQEEDLGESLWSKEIGSGSQVQLLPPQNVDFVGLSVSPDNAFVYYSVFSRNSVASNLSRVPLRGGSPEQLPDIAADVSVSFSPDGKRIAFTESHTGVKETQLKTANADGSDQRKLITAKGEGRVFPVFRANPVAWSPDGDTIACSVREIDENGPTSRILLVSPGDGSERYISAERWHYIENIAWIDSGNLAIIEREPNSPGSKIWRISRETGESEQMTTDMNSYSWLSSSGGNLFAVQKSVVSSLYVADFVDEPDGMQPIQVFSEFGVIANVAWSKEGKLFYNSWATGKNEIWMIDHDGTSPQRLTIDSNLVSFAVSPGDNALVFSTGQGTRISLSTADSLGQNIRKLTDGEFDVSPSVSPDGRVVVFRRGLGKPTLWQASIDGEHPPKQLTGYYAVHPAISPDGRAIAFQFMDSGERDPRWKLGLIDSETRRLLNKFELPESVTDRKMVWHPNGRLLGLPLNNGENVGILIISVTDGKFRTIENITRGKISSFSWSPDGRRFAFSQNLETSEVISLGGL